MAGYSNLIHYYEQFECKVLIELNKGSIFLKIISDNVGFFWGFCNTNTLTYVTLHANSNCSLSFVADHQKLEREARICRLLKHPNIGRNI